MKKMMFALAMIGCMAATTAYAQSSKAAWNYDDLVPLGTAQAVVPIPEGDPTPDGDTDWVTILTANIKTPNAKELAIGVSLQCGLVTDTTVRSKGGDSDTSAAQARINVRVKVTPEGGAPVYAAPSNSGADLTDIIPEPTNNGPAGVTYCDRFQKLDASFAGLNCYVDLADEDEDDVTNEILCLNPESLQLILKTLNAHHFNFLHANATPGVQKVEVQARAQAGVVLGGTELGEAKAEAFAGAGALSVETIRLVKGADGSNVVEIN